MTPMGFAARLLQECMALARTVLPVPLSPRKRMLASDGAACRARLTARCITGLVLENSTSGLDRPRSSCKDATLCSKARI